MGNVTFILDADEGKAVSAFLKVVDAQRKAEDGQKRLTGVAGEFDRTFDSVGKNAVGALTGMVTGFLTVGTAIAAVSAGWKQHEQDIRDSVAAMKEFQNEYVNLQFLGEHYKDPKFREKVQSLAVASGINSAELAKGMYTLESMAGYASDDQKNTMLAEAIKLRQASNTPLDQIVPGFAKMGAIYGNLSPREMANISQFLEERSAVASPEELANYAPQMYASGKVGNIDARTAAAIASVLTTKTGTAAQAASGMDVLLKKVMLADPDLDEAAAGFGKKSSKAGRQELLAASGIGDKDNAYERLMKLSGLYSQGKLGPQELKNLFGERGMRYAQILLENPEALRKEVGLFQEATGADKDIIGTKLGVIAKNDPIYRAMFAGQQAEAATAAAQQQPANLIWANMEKAYERIRIEQGPGAPIGAKQIGWADLTQAKVSAYFQNQEEQQQTAVRALASYMRATGYSDESYEDRLSKSKQWLGISGDGQQMQQSLDSATQNLYQATASLNEAANSLKDNAKNKAPNVNAHTE